MWWKLLRWANSEVKTTSLGGQRQQDSNDILAFSVYKRCFELASHVRGSVASYRKSRLEWGDLDRTGFGRNRKYVWREIISRSWFLIFFSEENSHSQACLWTWQTLKCERDSQENHSYACILSENSSSERARGTERRLSFFIPLSHVSLWPGRFILRSISFEKQCWERILWSRCAVFMRVKPWHHLSRLQISKCCSE